MLLFVAQAMVHSLWSKNVNNTAYSVNLRFKFHLLDGATIYNDA